LRKLSLDNEKQKLPFAADDTIETLTRREELPHLLKGLRN
jgi:hypothetical protein